MSLFPMFVKLAGRPCLVVGAGGVGTSKIEGLLAAGAAVRVVAPEATPVVADWSRAGKLSWQARGFESQDLDGAFLTVVATPSRELNARVFQEASRRGVLCNVVDDPPHCDFYYPAVVRRGDLQIAISTSGRSPALAARLRQDLEQQFGAEYVGWVEELGQEREKLLVGASGARPDARLDTRPEIQSGVHAPQPSESSPGTKERRERLQAMASREAFDAYMRRKV
jgi:precorrin-2 dehydrogenase / sirohydrochlorin ferrochelatase